MLAGPYGHPLHPVLVTVPIGAWVASFGFDIATRVADEADVFAKGAFWLIALGVLGALVAAMIGFLDLFAIPTGTTAFRTGLLHMSLNLVVVTLFAVSWVIRRGDIDAPTATSGALIGALGGGPRRARRRRLARREVELPLRGPGGRRADAGRGVSRQPRRKVMDVAALVTWLATAIGGFVLLGTWITKGGVRQAQAGQSRFPPAVIFGHFLLAAVGLVLWIVFLASDESSGLAWTAFVLLVVVALLGFAMFARWLAGRRTAAAGGPRPPP